MSRKKYLTTLALTAMSFFYPFAHTLQAQEKTRELSLEEATTNALTNNRSVQLANADISIAAANYKQTEAIYLPQIGISLTGMRTNNPLNAFGFKLQQQSITAADFNPALLNKPGGTSDFTTSLMIQQPLVNMDLVYQRKGAEKQIEIYAYKKQRTQEYIRFEVKKAYLGLQVSYKAVAVVEEAVSTLKAVLSFTDNHYRQGLVQKSDLLNVQVQLATAENNLAKAKSAIRNASDYLSLLMGTASGKIYTGSDMISTNEEAGASELSATRSDFVAMKKAIEASDLMIRSGKMSYLPKLNAFGAYQLNDSRLLGFGAGAYLAGIRVSWDIFKGNSTKNSITTQTLERNKLNTQLEQQKEQSNTELAKAKRDLSDIQFEITQYTKAIEQANESLRILQNRYEQGLVNTTDIMMATSQLSQQKLALAQAVYNKNLTEAYLQFITTSSTTK